MRPLRLQTFVCRPPDLCCQLQHQRAVGERPDRPFMVRAASARVLRRQPSRPTASAPRFTAGKICASQRGCAAHVYCALGEPRRPSSPQFRAVTFLLVLATDRVPAAFLPWGGAACSRSTRGTISVPLGGSIGYVNWGMQACLEVLIPVRLATVTDSWRVCFQVPVRHQPLRDRMRSCVLVSQ